MKSVRVYADYAAATPTDPEVIRAMAPFQAEIFGNPSSAHSFGKDASRALDLARAEIAVLLGCKSDEIVFTSGGTESNNLAIIGVSKAEGALEKQIIVSSIEHPSIMNACRSIEKTGRKVTYLPVDESGTVDAQELRRALTAPTLLVSIHLANSEIGVVQDIELLAKISHDAGALFHADACQAGSYLDLNIEKLGADLLTLNGSKLYGPKGVGSLFVKEGTHISPIVFGGGQERSLRSGTENVAGIVGLSKALALAQKNRVKHTRVIGQLRDALQQKLEQLPNIAINAKGAMRLPNHLSVTINNLENINIVERLDRLGVAVSAGSACGAKTLTDSHVLTAIGLTSAQIHATARITLGKYTTSQSIEKIMDAIRKIVKSS